MVCVSVLTCAVRARVCENDYNISYDSNWPRGVTVSTLDFESSDPGSNPGGTSAYF